MEIHCDNCGEILPETGFVVGINKENLCFKCGKQRYPAAFNRPAIYIFEDGMPGIVLPRGILIPKDKYRYKHLTSDMSDEILEECYQLIANKANCTRECIEELVYEKIEAFSGLVSEETALRLIAQDLGIEL